MRWGAWDRALGQGWGSLALIARTKVKGPVRIALLRTQREGLFVLVAPPCDFQGFWGTAKPKLWAPGREDPVTW